LIILAGASVRPITHSAAQSGFETLAIDFFGDLDCCGEVVTPHDHGLPPSTGSLLEIARGIDCSGLIYGAGPENHGPALQHWEERGLLLGNGPSTLAHARDPYLLRETLGQIGVEMPEFHSAEKPLVPGNRLLKPLFRGGGHGIIKLPECTTKARRVLSKLERPERYIVQEQLEGTPGSVTFLADGRRALVVGTSAQLTQGERSSFSYLGNIVPLPQPYPAFWGGMAKIASHLTAAFGLKGLGTLDFILAPSSVMVLELNPRWSGSVELIESWLGQSLFQAHLEACAGKLPDPAKWEKMISERPVRFYSKKIIYARTSFIVRNYYGGWQPLYDRGIRDIPKPGCQTREGEPICTVLAQGASEEECYFLLNKKETWVRKFYEQSEGR